MRCGIGKRKSLRGGANMSKAKMMTVSVHLRIPMFDLPEDIITAKGLAPVILKCTPEEMERYIGPFEKCPFSAEDL